MNSEMAATCFPAGVDGGTFSGSPIACHSIIAADKVRVCVYTRMTLYTPYVCPLYVLACHSIIVADKIRIHPYTQYIPPV